MYHFCLFLLLIKITLKFERGFVKFNASKNVLIKNLPDLDHDAGILAFHKRIVKHIGTIRFGLK